MGGWSTSTLNAQGGGATPIHFGTPKKIHQDLTIGARKKGRSGGGKVEGHPKVRRGGGTTNSIFHCGTTFWRESAAWQTSPKQGPRQPLQGEVPTALHPEHRERSAAEGAKGNQRQCPWNPQHVQPVWGGWGGGVQTTKDGGRGTPTQEVGAVCGREV